MEALNENSPEIKSLFSLIEQLHTKINIVSYTNKLGSDQDCYLTNKKVCNMLHISERTLQDYRDKGIISYYKLEGKILYKFSDIEKLLLENYFAAWK